MASGPLVGVKIVEFAGIGPGPFCGMLLADLGADVVRIDRAESVGRSHPDLANRGKRSIAIDLKKPEGIEAALSLIKAGLGWGWLPRSFVRTALAEGALRELPFDNLTNALELWVDVVWSKERPLGLGARRFIDMMRDARTLPASGGSGGAHQAPQAASL